MIWKFVRGDLEVFEYNGLEVYDANFEVHKSNLAIYKLIDMEVYCVHLEFYQERLDSLRVWWIKSLQKLT